MRAAVVLYVAGLAILVIGLSSILVAGWLAALLVIADENYDLLRGDRGRGAGLQGVSESTSRERVFSRPLLVQLGDEEDDLPLAVEPQAHRCARTLGEPAPDDVDAPVLVPAGIELAASERMGLVLP